MVVRSLLSLLSATGTQFPLYILFSIWFQYGGSENAAILNSIFPESLVSVSGDPWKADEGEIRGPLLAQTAGALVEVCRATHIKETVRPSSPAAASGSLRKRVSNRSESL